MALNIGDNFKYQGKKSNFERDSFTTKAAMKTFPETSIDEGHIAYCEEDGQHYVYSASNPMDGVTGKWKPQFKDYAKRTELTPIKKTVSDLEMNATVTEGTANTALGGATARFDEIDPTPTVNIEIQSSIVAGGIIVYSIAKKKFLYRVGGKYYSSWGAQDVPPMTLFQKVEGRTYICGTDMYVWDAVKNDLEKVTTDLTPVQAEIADIKSNITEYNVSKRHPNEGIGGTNKYTLAEAIKLIPAELRTVGIKCSFVGTDGIIEKYEYLGGEYQTGWLHMAMDEYIENQEYQHAVIDSEGHVIEAIRDQAKENFIPNKFHAGIEAPEIDGINNMLGGIKSTVEGLGIKCKTLDSGKENHIEGKSTINKDYADAKSVETNKEWAEVVLDINGAIIEGIRMDGTKHVHCLNVDTLALSEEAEKNIKRIANVKNFTPLHNQRYKDLFFSFFKYNIPEPDYSTDIVNPHVIHIRNQADFEPASIQAKICEGIAAGNKAIVLSLECANLYYQENHLLINKTKYPNAADVRLFIVGEDTILTSAGEDYVKANAISDEGDKYVCSYNGNYNPRAALLDQNGNMINMFDDVKYALSQATLDSATQTWKLKIHDEDMMSEATHIMITGDYVAPIYKIEKMEAGYVHFKNPDSYDWAPNGDYKYAKKYPRYALINSKNAPVHIAGGKIKIRKNLIKVHECKYGSFVNVIDGEYNSNSFVYSGNTFKSYDISGIKFVGNAYNWDKRTINFDASRNEHAWVHDCSFSHIFSEGIYARGGCANIKVSDCYFSDMYNGGICIPENKMYTSNNIAIVRNKFCNSSLHIPNIRSQIGVTAEKILIKNNELIDCTASIGVGIHNTMYQPSMKLGGIIEDNTMYFTREFAAQKHKHCYMDCGCMYCMMNENLHIRNNIIANYTSMMFGNGIYCDDGAKGLKIYSNAIINNDGNGGADIHSRMVDKRPDGSLIAGHNTDNHIGYNLLTTWYHFVGADNCTNGTNIILNDKNKSIVNVTNADDNYCIDSFEIHSNYIKVGAEYANVIKDIPVSEQLITKVLLFNKY